MLSFTGFALSFASICLGLSTLVLILVHSRQDDDPGIRLFLYPFVPLSLFAVSEFLAKSAIAFSVNPEFFLTASMALRLSFGLGWVLFCHGQYSANGVRPRILRLTVPFIAITLLNYAYFAGSHAMGVFTPGHYRVSIAVMSATALYAGIVAFILPAFKNPLYPSAWAGLRVAGASLIAYPVALVSDVFGYRYPWFDPTRLVWEQVFFFYYALASALIIPCFKDFFIRSTSRRAPIQVEILTRREREIILLIYEGKSYKEIALDLQISLSTLKTHVVNAYRKLGISRQTELPSVIGKVRD